MTQVELQHGQYLFGYRVENGKVTGGWVHPAPDDRDMDVVWRRWLSLAKKAEKDAGDGPIQPR